MTTFAKVQFGVKTGLNRFQVNCNHNMLTFIACTCAFIHIATNMAARRVFQTLGYLGKFSEHRHDIARQISEPTRGSFYYVSKPKLLTCEREFRNVIFF